MSFGGASSPCLTEVFFWSYAVLLTNKLFQSRHCLGVGCGHLLDDERGWLWSPLMWVRLTCVGHPDKTSRGQGCVSATSWFPKVFAEHAEPFITSSSSSTSTQLHSQSLCRARSAEIAELFVPSGFCSGSKQLYLQSLCRARSAEVAELAVVSSSCSTSKQLHSQCLAEHGRLRSMSSSSHPLPVQPQSSNIPKVFAEHGRLRSTSSCLSSASCSGSKQLCSQSLCRARSAEAAETFTIRARCRLGG